jgi:hypothetical protein
MLSLDDGKWKEFHGGYRIPYDASVALRSMQDGADVWNELWNELHHQGDVDVASYAAVPHLVRIVDSTAKRDWNFYGLVAVIEVERHRKGNPTVPAWLKADYGSAWARISALALADMDSKIDSATTYAILSVLALAKGELKLGAMLSGLDASELDEWLEERFAWSDVYED